MSSIANSSPTVAIPTKIKRGSWFKTRKHPLLPARSDRAFSRQHLHMQVNPQVASKKGTAVADFILVGLVKK